MRGQQPIEIASRRDEAKIRRLALRAQGLLSVRPFGSGLAGAKESIRHLGYVQIDTISVVERAHHHVIRSRVPNFTPAMTHRLLRERDIFEYWAHAAAFLPIEDFRFSLPYKQAITRGQVHWYKHPDKKLMRELLARIRSDGPLRSRDLEQQRSKGAGWWDWKPAKRALEQLYMQGDLMVSERDGFQKSYDLTERVLPAAVRSDTPSSRDQAQHLLAQQLRCHGFVSLAGLTYLRRNKALRVAMKALVAEQLSDGALQAVTLANGQAMFSLPGAFDVATPRVSDRLQILSPFDNSVIQRERLKALFDYDYKIECYLPAAKRRYGYFSLPLLFRDSFVGRMDCKAHRKDRCLEIKSLHWQDQGLDEEMLIDAFARAVEQFRQFQDCDTVTLNGVHPQRRMAALRRALIQLS